MQGQRYQQQQQPYAGGAAYGYSAQQQQQRFSPPPTERGALLANLARRSGPTPPGAAAMQAQFQQQPPRYAGSAGGVYAPVQTAPALGGGYTQDELLAAQQAQLQMRSNQLALEIQLEQLRMQQSDMAQALYAAQQQQQAAARVGFQQPYYQQQQPQQQQQPTVEERRGAAIQHLQRASFNRQPSPTPLSAQQSFVQAQQASPPRVGNVGTLRRSPSVESTVDVAGANDGPVLVLSKPGDAFPVTSPPPSTHKKSSAGSIMHAKRHSDATSDGSGSASSKSTDSEVLSFESVATSVHSKGDNAMEGLRASASVPTLNPSAAAFTPVFSTPPATQPAARSAGSGPRRLVLTARSDGAGALAAVAVRQPHGPARDDEMAAGANFAQRVRKLNRVGLNVLGRRIGAVSPGLDRMDAGFGFGAVEAY